MKPRLILAALVAFLAAGPLTPAHAQQPTQRMIRTYVPPDQLVSFQASIPFDQFVGTLNPIFQRVTGKQLIDPEGRTTPIGVTVVGQHFFDAFALVMQSNGLTYRENDRYFVVAEAPSAEEVYLQQTTSAAAGPSTETGKAVVAASLDTREVQINALLFDLNVTRARELGLDWQIGSLTGEPITVNTEGFFDLFGNTISGPSDLTFTTLSQVFTALEDDGVGNTLAHPQITVTSGVEGNIQIGSDIPIQTRDFAGNTITQFVQTGTIVKVTPTLITEPISDEEGAPLVDFIHLDVIVEKSGGRATSGGVPIIDRNRSQTKILLLDGEQTIIAGLYSTDETSVRRGIPFLKDLPPWLFGLRYLFGYEQRIHTQRELLIVLQANVLDSLADRSRRGQLPDGELLRQNREQQDRAVERAGQPRELKPSLR